MAWLLLGARIKGWFENIAVPQLSFLTRVTRIKDPLWPSMRTQVRHLPRSEKCAKTRHRPHDCDIPNGALGRLSRVLEGQACAKIVERLGASTVQRISRPFEASAAGACEALRPEEFLTPRA